MSDKPLTYKQWEALCLIASGLVKVGRRVYGSRISAAIIDYQKNIDITSRVVKLIQRKYVRGVKPIELTDKGWDALNERPRRTGELK